MSSFGRFGKNRDHAVGEFTICIKVSTRLFSMKRVEYRPSPSGVDREAAFFVGSLHHVESDSF